MTHTIPGAIAPSFSGVPSLPLSAFPLMPLIEWAPIEIKADTYGPFTTWYPTEQSIQGFQTWNCLSPVKGDLYVISYLPKRGCYGCSCMGGLKMKFLPLHLTEPTCWHLYEFNRQWLPLIMAIRNGQVLHTGIQTDAEKSADYRQLIDVEGDFN